jgi:hypothetical protein
MCQIKQLKANIHKLSYMVQIHAWHLKNLQVDCKVIIEDVELLKLPLRSNPGVDEDDQVCAECLKVDSRRKLKRIYVRERQKDNG